MEEDCYVLRACVSEEGDVSAEDQTGAFTFRDIYERVPAEYRYAVMQVRDEFWVTDLYRAGMSLETFRLVMGPHKVYRTLDAAIYASQVSLDLVEPYAVKTGGYPPLDFTETQVFYLGYGRNAWNSNWTNKYYPNSISFRIDELKELAEKRRVQGSVFTIEAIPMLVLSYKSEKFGICEINDRSEDEYLSLSRMIDRNCPDNLFSYLPESNSNLLLIFNVKCRSIPDLEYSNSAFKAVSRGPHIRLDWEGYIIKRKFLFLQFTGRLLDRLTRTP
ncbi:MAG: hypothetical protein MN733_33110 [Nitrososphaera sp.]|nr:hypothetical protein [Nitrososphaera sp.]